MVVCAVGTPKKSTRPVTAGDGRVGSRGPPKSLKGPNLAVSLARGVSVGSCGSSRAYGFSRASQKSTRPETANDGRAGSRAPFKPSRVPKEPQKHVPGYLRCPAYVVVPVVWRLGSVGSQGGLHSTQTEPLA